MCVNTSSRGRLKRWHSPLKAAICVSSLFLFCCWSFSLSCSAGPWHVLFMSAMVPLKCRWLWSCANEQPQRPLSVYFKINKRHKRLPSFEAKAFSPHKSSQTSNGNIFMRLNHCPLQGDRGWDMIISVLVCRSEDRAGKPWQLPPAVWEGQSAERTRGFNSNT